MRYEIALNGKLYEVEVEDNRAMLGAVGAAPVRPAPGQPGVRLVRRPAPSGAPIAVRAPAASGNPAASGSPAPSGRPAAPVQPAPLKVAAPAVAPGAGAGEPLTAPMPGLVKDILVQPGQRVKAGQPLVILEAMKMENEIVSPGEATITQVVAAKGQTVNAGAVLVKLAR